MKVSEVSNDELNRFNANVFEPEPELPYYPKDFSLCMQGFADGRIATLSPKLAHFMQDADFRRQTSWYWQPLDFCTSGDGLKMMLEHLQATKKWDVRMACPQEFAILNPETEDYFVILDKPLCRAVAEAFALANGWKE